MSGLTMRAFLLAVRDHQTGAREALIDAGFHPNVVYAKAVKAARKHYTEYGVVADRPWLTPKGERYLTDALPPSSNGPHGPVSPPATGPARTVEVSDRTGRTDPDVP